MAYHVLPEASYYCGYENNIDVDLWMCVLCTGMFYTIGTCYLMFFFFHCFRNYYAASLVIMKI